MFVHGLEEKSRVGVIANPESVLSLSKGESKGAIIELDSNSRTFGYDGYEVARVQPLLILSKITKQISLTTMAGESA